MTSVTEITRLSKRVNLRDGSCARFTKMCISVFYLFISSVLVVAHSLKGGMNLICVWSAPCAQQTLDASLSSAGSVRDRGKVLDLVLISVEMWDAEVLIRSC